MVTNYVVPKQQTAVWQTSSGGAYAHEETARWRIICHIRKLLRADPAGFENLLAHGNTAVNSLS